MMRTTKSPRGYANGATVTATLTKVDCAKVADERARKVNEDEVFKLMKCSFCDASGVKVDIISYNSKLSYRCYACKELDNIKGDDE